MFVAVAGCAGAKQAAGNTNAPLQSCETRELELHGADVVVMANADASLASVDVVSAPDAASRNKAYDDVLHAYGPVRRDSRIVARPSKWGLATYTDACGHPLTVVVPSASPAH